MSDLDSVVYANIIEDTKNGDIQWVEETYGKYYAKYKRVSLKYLREEDAITRMYRRQGFLWISGTEFDIEDEFLWDAITTQVYKKEAMKQEKTNQMMRDLQNEKEKSQKVSWVRRFFGGPR